MVRRRKAKADEGTFRPFAGSAIAPKALRSPPRSVMTTTVATGLANYQRLLANGKDVLHCCSTSLNHQKIAFFLTTSKGGAAQPNVVRFGRQRCSLSAGK